MASNESAHDFHAVLDAAAHGVFPAANGEVTLLPAAGATAIVGFTRRHFILADVPADEVAAHLDDDFAAPMLPPFIEWLAQRTGTRAGFADIVLARFGTGGKPKMMETVPLEEVEQHPRVARAIQHRAGLTVWASATRSELAIVGRGLAGRVEISVEIDEGLRGSGRSVPMIRDAVQAIPKGTPVFAQISPGNVASLRAFLAADFRPICSEIIFSA